VRRSAAILGAAIAIILVVQVLFILTFVPNPLLKNSPWTSVEGILLVPAGVLYVPPEIYVVVGFHNPTHRSYSVEMIGGTFHGEFFLETEGGVALGTRVLEFRVMWFIEPASGRSMGSFVLQPCSPSYLIVELMGTSMNWWDQALLYVRKASVTLEMQVKLNGEGTRYTNNYAATFVSVSMNNSREERPTTQAANSTLPSECLIPWI
jgi:hypothetical protein